MPLAADVRVLNRLALALRLLVRDLRAGELRLMFASLVLAVASFTTVAFFADRVRLALVQEAAQLLGADLVVIADHPLDAAWSALASDARLDATRTVRFPSMVTVPDRATAVANAGSPAGDDRDGALPDATGSADAATVDSLLVEIKAVGDGYPLKGRLRVDGGTGGDLREVRGAPPAGTVWVDGRALARLGLRVGDRMGVGEARLTIGARLVDDPDSAVGFLNVMPRVVVGDADLAATGLLTTGSRATWRLMLRGPRDALAQFRDQASARVGPGERVEDVRDARPEIRNALERAGRFLGLAALLSVVLAAVAVGLAARRWLQRHLDAVALMRCLGASRGSALGLHAAQLAVLGLVGGVAGAAIGFAAQGVLAQVLAPLVQVALPSPSVRPALLGVVAGFVMLLGFALPPLVDLGRVPALRVLRRDLAPPRAGTWAGYAAGLAAIGALVLWQTQDAKLAGFVLGGLVAAGLVAGAVALAAVRAAAQVGRGAGFAWRFGLANLRRRAVGSVVQIVALATGLLALLLLAITQGDLLAAWRGSVPPEAPNRFVVNIQPDQRDAVAAFFAAQGGPVPRLYPMVRGRLTAINGRAVTSADYAEDRAKRLVDREFNLSWAEQPQVDNVVVQGRWWTALEAHAAAPPVAGAEPADPPATPRVASTATDGAAPRAAEFSFEVGIAEALGVRLGDRIAYDVAGSALEGPVTSLRTVDWDSFRVNFFVVAPPGALDAYPATWVTSFHLPAAQAALSDALVRRFPNLLVIDVGAVLAQVQTLMAQVVRAVEFVFVFSVIAGLAVLFAAIQSTHDERRHEAAILRTLGASGRQIAATQAAEFAVVGVLAGLLAAGGATGLGWVLAKQVLNVPYAPSLGVWVAGLLAGGVGVLVAGMLGTRGVLRAAPMETLRRG